MACETCSTKIKDISNISNGICDKCSVRITAYHRYFAANIPFIFWSLSMNKDFVGDNKLLDLYKRLASDINKTYADGNNIMLVGTHGSGKSLTMCSILKAACHKNYHCLYTTLTDVVSSLIEAPYEEKYLSRQELQQADFLFLDEVDNRFISNGGADLFGRTVENILRTRLQNGLPTFYCSNSPNPTEFFQGPVKEALGSLMNKVEIIPVLAKDFRKEQKEYQKALEEIWALYMFKIKSVSKSDYERLNLSLNGKISSYIETTSINDRHHIKYIFQDTLEKELMLIKNKL